MRYIGYVTFALLTAGALASPASANMCRTDRLTCATTMPVDGYCQCTAHGVTEDGTVVSNAEARQSKQKVNSTAGGCGANPKAPGCR